MPVDMKVPKKIPVGDTGPMGDLERVEIEFLDDGGAVVTCLHRPGEGGGGLMLEKPKRYAFQDPAKLMSFLQDKISEAGGGESAEPAGPEEGEELPDEEPLPEDAGAPPGPPAAVGIAGPGGAAVKMKKPLPPPPPPEEEPAY